MSNLQVGIVMGNASEATVKLLVTAIRDIVVLEVRRDRDALGVRRPSFRQLDSALKTMSSRKMLSRLLTPVV